MLKNIMAPIVNDLVDNYLRARTDVCKCPKCKTDIIAYVLTKLPARYVTTDTGAIQSIIEQTKFENEAVVIKKIVEATDIVRKNPRHELKEDKEKAFKLLLNNIYLERGVDFSRYQKDLLKRRIGTRMTANGVDAYSDYLRLLITKPEEYAKLFDALTISVSEFFRDSEVYKIFNELLTDLIKEKIDNNENSIRIWSAGCANGEETYSIAILANAILNQENISEFYLEIFGTDIDDKCIKNAKEGVYDKLVLRNVNKYLLTKYFIPINENKNDKNEGYKIKPEIKNLVKFQYHNMISDRPFDNLDFIFCRNVFIFLNRSLQEHLIMTFYNALRQGGYLILGAVEVLLGEAREIFVEVDLKNKIYRKK